MPRIFAPSSPSSTLRGGLIYFICLNFAGIAHGQVVMGQPRTPQAPAAQRSGIGGASSSTLRPGALSSIHSALVKQGPLAQWGPVALRPYASYSFQYGDGFLRVPGEPENSSLQMVRLGLLTELGTTWNLEGSIARSMYSSRLLSDTYDSNLRLSGKWSFDSWNIGVSQGYTSDSPIVAETGSQNDERTTTTSANISYNPGDKTSVDISAVRSGRLADPKTQTPTWTGSDWTQISLSGWLNYQATLKVGLSAGYQIGWDDLSRGDDMSYTRPQIRARWQPSDRLIFAASWGVERRKVDAAGGRNNSSPVYDVSVSYSPTLTTSLSLGGTRDTSTSYFNDQTIQTTRLTASVGQRLLQRYFLSLSATYGESEYAATNSFFFTDRSDESHSYAVGLSTSFLRRGSISFSYSWNQNSSNRNIYRFSSSQIGMNVGYRF